MVLTTNEASYIIVLGIVISVLPISSTGGRTLIPTSTTRSIHRYQLTFSTWRLRLDFIPVDYLLVLDRSQRGYFSLEVQSCTFTIQFYIMDISITFFHMLILSTFGKASC